MKRLDQGHLLEHPKQTCPGRSLNLRPLVPQDSTLAKSYCNSLCFCYSETVHPVFPVISDTNRMQYEVGTLANSNKQNIRMCVMLESLPFLFCTYHIFKTPQIQEKCIVTCNQNKTLNIIAFGSCNNCMHCAALLSFKMSFLTTRRLKVSYNYSKLAVSTETAINKKIMQNNHTFRCKVSSILVL